MPKQFNEMETGSIDAHPPAARPPAARVRKGSSAITTDSAVQSFGGVVIA
jgi:hypothetical protein